MSTQRFTKLPRIRRGPNGEHLCRRCGAQVPHGRREWCGQACVKAYIEMSDPKIISRRILERDNGTCAMCGFDCLKAQNELQDLRRNSLDEFRRYPYAAWQQRKDELRAKGFRVETSLWEADHILEVVNGGGECGIENYQTLCQPCHKAKTKRLAQQRAEVRRLARMPLLKRMMASEKETPTQHTLAGVVDRE